jgi:hypothetical protein
MKRIRFMKSRRKLKKIESRKKEKIRRRNG